MLLYIGIIKYIKLRNVNFKYLTIFILLIFKKNKDEFLAGSEPGISYDW